MSVENYLRIGKRLMISVNQQYGSDILGGGRNVARFLHEYKQFNQISENPNFEVSLNDFYPCLVDKTAKTPLDPVYFYQDTWSAHKIFQLKPNHHYDVGSSAKTIGIISQYVPTTMIDIRPIDLSLENLSFVEGSILALPFADNSIESLSSLCVVEHIGLGRYGDPIDPWGSEKAIRELKRVLRRDGVLLFSIPVDQKCRVYFNAHRAFTRAYILELFSDMKLIEEKYVYGKKVYDCYDADKGFGTGLFQFRK
jgi:SAM-dependent methyltransferase